MSCAKFTYTSKYSIRNGLTLNLANAIYGYTDASRDMDNDGGENKQGD